MRHFGFIALLAPFAVLAFGCEEDPSSSPGGFQLPEAGGGFEIPDSGSPTPDSSTPDAASSGVTVTVKKDGVPRKDVRVIFHDATGAVTGDFKTDAAGVLTQPAAPSMVTILAPGAEIETELAPLTYLGVAEGDALTVELDGVNVVSKIGEYSVTLSGGFDNAEQYSVQAGSDSDCERTFGPRDGTFIVNLYPACVGAQGAVLATASAGDEPLAFAFAKNLAKPMGGATITVPALGPFVAAGSLTVTAANSPPNAQGWAAAAALVDGRSFDLVHVGGDFPAEPLTFHLPIGFGDAHQAVMGSSADGSTRTIVKREPATVRNISFDSASLLPSLGGLEIVADDPKRPKATWSPSAPLTGTDGGVLMFTWYQDSTPLRWSFVIPPGTTEVTAPALPADLAIPPSTQADLSHLAFVEATHLEGYKAFKSLPMPSGDAPRIFWTDAPLPANGTVRTVRIGD